MSDEKNLDILNQRRAENSYLSEIEKIESSKQPIESTLSLIDIIVRDFLIKKFHILKNSEYDELVDYFLQKNKPEVATFCYEMVEALYSGEKINGQKLKALIEDLKTLIEKEQHFIKEEKKESYFSGISKIWKKSRKLPKDLGLVSKQIKRYIDLEIGKYDANAKPAEKENVLLEMMPVRQISIKKESAGEPHVIQNEESSHPSIEHIDNLERIRRRIEEKRKHRVIYAQ